MMELLIRLKGGKPFEHPITVDNFQQAFPGIDLSNLPNWVARFERIPPPELGTYEVYEETLYVMSDSGVVQDVHQIRNMTESERKAKIDSVLAKPVFASWVFDEPSCSWKPPVPYPTDGKHYRWDESITNWVEVTLNQGV